MNTEDALTPVPDMDVVYTQYLGRFYGVLARLVREGYTAQPAESLDLIHDFFASEWEPLVKNYHSDRGPLENYACASFHRFARRRIIQESRRQTRLHDAAYLAQRCHTANPSPLDVLAAQEEHEAFRQVLAVLPAGERSIFQKYLAYGFRSQRQLTREFSRTRYQINELVVRVLCQLFMALAEREQLPDQNWRVLQALWGEGRTVAETAACLHLSIAEVNQVRSQLLELLTDRLTRKRRDAWPGRSGARRDVPQGRPSESDTPPRT